MNLHKRIKYKFSRTHKTWIFTKELNTSFQELILLSTVAPQITKLFSFLFFFLFLCEQSLICMQQNDTTSPNYNNNHMLFQRGGDLIIFVKNQRWQQIWSLWSERMPVVAAKKELLFGRSKRRVQSASGILDIIWY